MRGADSRGEGEEGEREDLKKYIRREDQEASRRLDKREKKKRGGEGDWSKGV